MYETLNFSNGDELKYDFLVVAAGLQLRFDMVEDGEGGGIKVQILEHYDLPQRELFFKHF
jgi:hypothetical protein